jgi:DNA invertase Pin-like site-specific DNA recombinase
MRIGYARVSTTEQNLDLQRDALKRSGCERIIEETASGGKVQRSGLERVQEMLRRGDVLAVWRLDRLGRSPRERPAVPPAAPLARRSVRKRT